MVFKQVMGQVNFLGNVRGIFKDRDLFFHDGGTMRRVRLSARMQVLAAAGLLLSGTSAIAGVAAVAFSAPGVSSAIAARSARQAEVAKMEARVAALQSEVASIRSDATLHAKRLEQRQAFLANLIEGKATPVSLSALVPAHSDRATGTSADIVAAFSTVEAQQAEIAGKVNAITEARYRIALTNMSRLGLNAQRFQPAMGGPYEPATAAEIAASSKPVAAGQADPQFRALFNSWKRLDQLQQGIVAIPSQKPVQTVAITSNFGVRSDPFRGGAAMHAGVDIPGAYATPIYATADGIVGRSGWVGGYGNLVEIEHGRGIVTRYGHLSSSIVAAGTRVKRGQMIAYMGSTGRSTGNHLHYEVRIDGRAVNPMPFLQSGNYLMAMERRAQNGNIALGGPAKGE
jgi:murein DD-endopeptidase MepM/ murein hydrolase activator NlpD